MPPDLPEALEELHLQGNRIRSVDATAFLGTPRLRALFLRCSPRAQQAGKGPWLNGGALTQLLALLSESRENQLHTTSIAREAFLGLPHLRLVDTAGNPEQVVVWLAATATQQPRTRALL